MAREKRPAIIFIDEIDSLCGNRSDGETEASRRVKTEFLVQMQGVGKDDEGILVLGATNIPWGLDPAIRRRFERRIYIPLPDFPARLYLLTSLVANTPHSLTQEDLELLAEETEGFSGADISILVRDAAYQPLRKTEQAQFFRETRGPGGKRMFEACPPTEPGGIKMRMMDLKGDELKLPDIGMDDFQSALIKCKPSVSGEDIKRHIQFTEQFGQEGQSYAERHSYTTYIYLNTIYIYIYDLLYTNH
eukprot:TRINITY_DN3254_c0_g1_i3.p1 TRINITY_DN3254_c0_g1~~TRINITY_DN3254_c0_g1_i3.p1  ORF type:complete len:247 (-),score=64.24 TRINITY_DN3254_c0_g1_i3:291-1031(-)